MDINGCVNQWLVGDMPGNVNRWTVVTGGTEGSHQHIRDESSAFSHAGFYKIQNSSVDTCPDGQQSSFELPQSVA